MPKVTAKVKIPIANANVLLRAGAAAAFASNILRAASRSALVAGSATPAFVFAASGEVLADGVEADAAFATAVSRVGVVLAAFCASWCATNSASRPPRCAGSSGRCVGESATPTDASVSVGVEKFSDSPGVPIGSSVRSPYFEVAASSLTSAASSAP